MFSKSYVVACVVLLLSTQGPLATAAPAPAAGSSAIGNFGSCTVPEIEFGPGFDNRRETSFRPVDRDSYNIGSAINIAVITRFICDALNNKCNADATAKATCTRAADAASAAPRGSGAQADAFNAVFGIKTNYVAVPPV